VIFLKQVPVTLNDFSGVMAPLNPSIRALLPEAQQVRTWMLAISAGMTGWDDLLTPELF
jgi:hypothetical protein